MYKIVLGFGVILIDIALIIYNYPLNVSIGWVHVILAMFLQFIWWVIVIVLVRVNGFAGSKRDEDQFSYRSYFSVGWVGFLIVSLAFTLTVLYIGIVCPEANFPMVRGRSICAS